MNILNAFQPDMARQWSSGLSAKQTSASRATQLNASSLQSGDISIRTKEGDTVTLSMSNQTQVAYADYTHLARSSLTARSATGQVNATRTDMHHEEQLSLQSSRHLSISIQGDLNAEELRDIQRVVKNLDKLARGFMEGRKTDNSLASLMQLDKLETISGFEASFHNRRTLAASQATTYTQQAMEQRLDPAKQAQLNDLQEVLSQMTRVVEAAKSDPDKLAGPVSNMFDHLRDELDDEESGDRGLQKLNDVLKENVLNTLRRLKEEKEENSPETEEKESALAALRDESEDA